MMLIAFVFFFQAEDGIRAGHVTGVQTCALPIFRPEIATDGSIEMHGLFELTDAAPAETGARLNTNPDPTELELFPTVTPGQDDDGEEDSDDDAGGGRSEEHTSELQSRGHLVCRLLLEKKKYQLHKSQKHLKNP